MMCRFSDFSTSQILVSNARSYLSSMISNLKSLGLTEYEYWILNSVLDNLEEVSRLIARFKRVIILLFSGLIISLICLLLSLFINS